VILQPSLCLALTVSALAQLPQNIVITSASSFRVGVPPQGSIGAIFCTGLNISGTVQADGAPLPWSLAGVSVTVGGAQAPIFSVSGLSGYQQINFEVPQEAVVAGYSIPITVTQNGVTGSTTAAAQSYLYLPSPGDFFTLPNSSYGAFQHAADYSAITAANPAKAGEAVIGYLTGLGETAPLVPTGQASPYSPLAIVPQTAGFIEYALISPSFAPTSIIFLGLTPGLVGVYQANFILPAIAPPGDLTIQLQLQYCQDACIHGGEEWEYSQPVLLPVR
jgi:uncharacterized protein (TIGR03437 family)